MVLRGINRTVWGTRLLLTPVLASFVDCISLCHKLKAQHCSLSLSGCFNPETGMQYFHSPMFFLLRVSGLSSAQLKITRKFITVLPLCTAWILAHMPKI